MKKALIFLQEVGDVPLPFSINKNLEKKISDGLSNIAENINDVITRIQGMKAYDKVKILSDQKCTRERLLKALIDFSQRDYVIDLIIWGHGGENVLYLHGEERLWGRTRYNDGNIYSLLTEAQALGCPSFNLRLVYMCNCQGSTLNDDWLEIGAKVSIGPKQNNYMPTPTTPFFLFNWTSGDKAKNAAKNAYKASIPFFTPFLPPSFEPQYQDTEIRYPCPEWDDPAKTCYKTISLPSIPKLIRNEKISSSKLMVSGDGNIRC